MRMARIKYKLTEDAPPCELISAPTNFRIAVDALGGATVSLLNQDWYTLTMPLDEALEELNAAMNDNPVTDQKIEALKRRFEREMKWLKERGDSALNCLGPGR